MITTVSVPATSANLGPGFDCLGLALGLYNSVTFTPAPAPGVHITAAGVDADKIPTGAENLVATALEAVRARVGARPFNLHVHQQNQIPVGSGLGSSAAAIVAGLLGGNRLLGSPLTRAELLEMAVALEGHPDNVAPALYGNLVLAVAHAGGLHVEPIGLPPLRVAVVLPDFALATSAARAALPRQVSLADAVFNAGRTPLVVRALETADYAKLRIAMQDRLHQPYRIPLVPGLAKAFEAATAAGAAAVALSGAGPSLIAFAATGHAQIATAVQNAFAAAGYASRHWILPIDTAGAR